MSIFHKASLVDDVFKKIKENQGLLLVVLGLIVAMVGGIYGYSYYKKNREESAYRALTLALEYFDAPVKKDGEKAEDMSFLGSKDFKTSDEKWEKVEAVFKKEYEAHKSSGIAALFLAYQSQALVELKKIDDAITVLRAAINTMKSQPVKDYYEIKLALMLVDKGDATLLKEGLDILTQKANKESNVAHDMALYHLGQYYWYEKKYEEARNYWNQLVLKYDKQDRTASPWVTAAKEKLGLIDSDVE